MKNSASRPLTGTDTIQPDKLYVDGDGYVFCLDDTDSERVVFLAFVGGEPGEGDHFVPWGCEKSAVELPISEYAGTVTLSN